MAGLLGQARVKTESVKTSGGLLAKKRKTLKADTSREDLRKEQLSLPIENKTLTGRVTDTTLERIKENVVLPNAPKIDPLKTSIPKISEKRTPADIKRQEEIMKSSGGQFLAGAYEGSPTARTIASMEKISGKGENPAARYARESQPYKSGFRTAGSLFSGVVEGIATYGTLGKAISGAKFLEAVKNPFVRNVIGGQIADTILQSPAVISEGIAQKKDWKQILADVGIQQASDLVMNTVFAGAELGFSKLAKNRAKIEDVTGIKTQTDNIAAKADVAPLKQVDNIPAKAETPQIKQPWEMNRQEIKDAYSKAKDYEKNLDRRILGGKYDEYNKAYKRQDNLYISKEERLKAEKTVENIENSLSESQRNEFFGIGEYGRDVYVASDYKNYIDALDKLDWGSPKELGNSLKYAMTEVGNKTNPALMNSKELQAYMQLKYAFEEVNKMGWNANEVSNYAIKASASRFSDSEDAMMMLDRFINPKRAKTDITPKLQLPKATGIKSQVDSQVRPDMPLIPKAATVEASTPSILKSETGSIKLSASGRPDVGMKINDNVQFTTPDTTSRIVKSAEAQPSSVKDVFSRLYNKFVNRQNELVRFAKTVAPKDAAVNSAIMASNARNVPGVTKYILKDGLSDMKGNTIGDSYKSIVDKIDAKHEIPFADYVLHKHNIARMGEETPVFGKEITADISKVRVAEYEAKFPEFKNISDELNSFNKKFGDEWLVNSGLITKDTWIDWLYRHPNWVRTSRMMDEAETVGRGFGAKKGFANQGAGIKKATGSSRKVVNPLETNVDYIESTVKAAKNNEVMQWAVREAKNNPEAARKWFEIIEEPKQGLLDDINKVLDEEGIDRLIDKYNDQFDTVFNKNINMDRNNIVRVMVNGEPIKIKVNNKDYLEAVIGLNNPTPSSMEAIGRFITTPFKALITSDNPIFAFFNFFRDTPMAYIHGTEKNPFKFLNNLYDAAKETAVNGAMRREYKALGGGGSGFFHERPVTYDIKMLANKKLGTHYNVSKLNNLYKEPNAIKKFNNAIEDVNRFSEYLQTVKKGGNTFEAKMDGLNKANNVTVNFAKSGPVTKSADAWVPYLNPGIQGLNRMIEAVVKHPLETIGKGVLIITVPTVALHFINKGNPYYQELSNYAKDSFYNFPNPFDRDEKGIPKTFIKIPKTREYGAILGVLFDRILRATEGEKKPFKDMGKSFATNFAPTNPLESNIFSPMITNIPSNKDFAGRTIVPQSMQKLSPRYQYDETTSEIAKFIGDKMNLSPKQIDYLIKSYTGVIGQFALPLTTKSTYAGKTPSEVVGGFIEKTLGRRFTSDPLYSNDIVNDFYENKEKYNTAIADFKQKRVKSKDYSIPKNNVYNKASELISDWFKLIQKIQDNKTYSETYKKQRSEEIRRKILDKAKSINERFIK